MPVTTARPPEGGSVPTKEEPAMTLLKKLALAVTLLFTLAMVTPPAVMADDLVNNYEEPKDGAIVLDLVVLRPLGLVGTVVGTALFLVALPLSIPTGSINGTFTHLVKRPFVFTFVRELGEEQ